MAAPLSSEGRVHAVLRSPIEPARSAPSGRRTCGCSPPWRGTPAWRSPTAQLVGRLRAELSAKEHAATHDALTGMANRRGLLGHVPDLLAGGVTGDDPCGRAGPVPGRERRPRPRLRRPAAAAVGAALPALTGGFAARLGGDEFAVAAPVAGLEQALEIAELVRAAIASPVVIDGLTVHTAATVGIALAPEHGDDPAELLQHADLALALGEATRAPGCQVYDPQEGARAFGVWRWPPTCGWRWPRARLEVWYQPQAEARTGKVVGVEALLRWRHPVFGSVRPDEAIALAEQTGLMPDITEYVLRTALDQRAQWAADGIHLDVAVNLSARDLMDPELPAKVAGCWPRAAARPLRSPWRSPRAR